MNELIPVVSDSAAAVGVAVFLIIFCTPKATGPKEYVLISPPLLLFLFDPLDEGSAATIAFSTSWFPSRSVIKST